MKKGNGFPHFLLPAVWLRRLYDRSEVSRTGGQAAGYRGREVAKKATLCIPLGLSLLLMACTPVKSTISNQYRLSAFSNRQLAKSPVNKTVLVATPQAVASYQGTDMYYTDKPYELASFAHNSWIDSPANMLFPLLLQSLQKANYFRAVASSPYSEVTDYRLDTQILEWQQNFLKNPSVLQISLKVVLSDIKNSRVVGSRIMRQQIRCPQNTPYGGVIAANIAVERLTADITRFTIAHARGGVPAGK